MFSHMLEKMKKIAQGICLKNDTYPVKCKMHRISVKLEGVTNMLTELWDEGIRTS